MGSDSESSGRARPAHSPVPVTFKPFRGYTSQDISILSSLHAAAKGRSHRLPTHAPESIRNRWARRQGYDPDKVPTSNALRRALRRRMVGYQSKRLKSLPKVGERTKRRRERPPQLGLEGARPWTAEEDTLLLDICSQPESLQLRSRAQLYDRIHEQWAKHIDHDKILPRSLGAIGTRFHFLSHQKGTRLYSRAVRLDRILQRGNACVGHSRTAEDSSSDDTEGESDGESGSDDSNDVLSGSEVEEVSVNGGKARAALRDDEDQRRIPQPQQDIIARLEEELRLAREQLSKSHDLRRQIDKDATPPQPLPKTLQPPEAQIRPPAVTMDLDLLQERIQAVEDNQAKLSSIAANAWDDMADDSTLLRGRLATLEDRVELLSVDIRGILAAQTSFRRVVERLAGKLEKLEEQQAESSRIIPEVREQRGTAERVVALPLGPKGWKPEHMASRPQVTPWNGRSRGLSSARERYDDDDLGSEKASTRRRSISPRSPAAESYRRSQDFRAPATPRAPPTPPSSHERPGTASEANSRASPPRYEREEPSPSEHQQRNPGWAWSQPRQGWQWRGAPVSKGPSRRPPGW